MKASEKESGTLNLRIIGALAFGVVLYCAYRLIMLSDFEQDPSDDSLLLPALYPYSKLARFRRDGLRRDSPAASEKLWNLFKNADGNPVIPYVFYNPTGKPNEHFNSDEMDAIREVMDTIESNTCIRFARKSTWSSNRDLTPRRVDTWLELRKPQTACNAHIGRLAGAQGANIVTLADRCIIKRDGTRNKAKLFRLLLHTIGLNLEQLRTDRDDFIKVDENNIRQGQAGVDYRDNFKKNDPNEFDSYGVPYNYFSVMHDKVNILGKTENGKIKVTMFVDNKVNPNQWQEIKAGGILPGSVIEPAESDYEIVRKMYDCPEQTAPDPGGGTAMTGGTTDVHHHHHHHNGGSHHSSHGGHTGLPWLSESESEDDSEDDDESSSEDKQDCEDTAGDCAAKRSLCNNPDYHDLVFDVCKKTCGVCAGAHPAQHTALTCVDTNHFCHLHKDACEHSATRHAMTIQCPYTCERCGEHYQHLQSVGAVPGPTANAFNSMNPMMNQQMMMGQMGMMNPMAMMGTGGMGGPMGMEAMMNPMMMNPMMGGMNPMFGGSMMNPMMGGMNPYMDMYGMGKKR
ncbi:astacin (Peptidase family m12A) domain-containing protein [Ditylenchus destructor]|uniref:Metalloendopeptidase n=1 Tax=Ditylenchus destructor TaxID=166010 RepID=A0AAD4QZD8_9BILA|nr:astacin (Peptidase family m12A) domain-containing protein [Ditylenchus destructor]